MCCSGPCSSYMFIDVKDEAVILTVVLVQLPEASPPPWCQHGRHLVSVHFHHEEPACCGSQWSGCRKGLSASAGVPQVCLLGALFGWLWRKHHVVYVCHTCTCITAATCFPYLHSCAEPEKTLCDALWPASLMIREVTWLMWVCSKHCDNSLWK